MDKIGKQTLEIMQDASYYNNWILRLILPWTSGEVAEVGAGMGLFSGMLSKKDFSITSIDYDQQYLEIVKSKYPEVKTFQFDLQTARISSSLVGKFDTVIAINVLEHLPDLTLVLDHISQMLRPGGKLIVVIPAFKFAYGTLDRNLGHVRRYTNKQFQMYLKKAGLSQLSSRYFNFWGLLGWMVNSRIFKRIVIPASQVRIFDLLFRPWMELERYLKLPLGLSLLSVSIKK